MTIIDLSYPRRFVQNTIKNNDDYFLFSKILGYNAILTTLPISNHHGSNVIDMNFFYYNILAILDTMKSVNYYKINAMINWLTWKK